MAGGEERFGTVVTYISECTTTNRDNAREIVHLHAYNYSIICVLSRRRMSARNSAKLSAGNPGRVTSTNAALQIIETGASSFSGSYWMRRRIGAMMIGPPPT